MDYDLIAGLTANNSTAQQSHEMLLNLPSSELTHTLGLASAETVSKSHAGSRLLQDSMPNRNTAGAVITMIEEIFEFITDVLLDEKNEFTICLKTRPKRHAQEEETDNGKKKSMSGLRKVTFPNRNPKEAWKFSR
jgi:meiotic recombination protein SPO11